MENSVGVINREFESLKHDKGVKEKPGQGNFGKLIVFNLFYESLRARVPWDSSDILSSAYMTHKLRVRERRNEN